MSQKYDKLKTLLKELFQLDQPDLDFGIYRIMHARSAEVTQFLERDLLPQVKEAFAKYQSADRVGIQKELDTAIEDAKKLGVDPNTAPKVQNLRARLSSDAVDLDALEAEVYDHLFSFFRRYYSEGDFLSKRVYKPGVYAIPYEGEEVKLHWANADQYYIKTSEYLRDYAFRLRPNDAQHPMRVHFRLVEAAEGEHGTVKEHTGSERRFQLAPAPFATMEDGELVLHFTYQSDPHKRKQKDLNATAEAAILGLGEPALAEWLSALGAAHVRADGTSPGSTRLRVHLDRYTARNTFDYFIHKDLGGFLRRELDFYIKNEVMHLDDVENETAPRVEQYLSKIKVLRRIAGKIITFLAQLEDFQKKLWLKKKFVTEASYCIRLGVIPEAFYPEIAANDAQREEWVRLCAIDELKPTDSSLLEPGKPGYTSPLTVEFLKAHPTLMVDTRHFDAGFTARLVETIGNVDEQTDGVLYHSENFQALSLMQPRYREKVKCIYIDPPYNTGSDGFSYRDSYQNSCWLSMLYSRFEAATSVMRMDGVVFASIDDREQANLRKLFEELFGSNNFANNIIWQKKFSPQNDARWLSDNHDFLICFARSKQDWKPGFLPRTEKQDTRYQNPDNDPRGPWMSSGLDVKTYAAEYDYEIITPSGRVVWPPKGACWRISKERFQEMVSDNRIWFGPQWDNVPRIKRFLSEVKQGVTPLTLWTYQEVGHNQEGAQELKAMMQMGDVFFASPKPTRLLKRVITIGAEGKGAILDFFAGSGTTGHAVISLNREDGGQRKFILVEQADYFDTVLLPRLKKVTFTPEWKDGKPKRLATAEEAERSPRIMKVIRLESYEDTLNNLELHRTKEQQELLDLAPAKGADKLREQYLLRYLLNVESRGSQSLLNIEAFTDPTAYTLRVKRPGSDESQLVNVDLLETFNWLIGLTVDHIAAPRTFSADTTRDSEGRLRLTGRLRQEDEGRWWFRTVAGTTRDGRRTLVIWRKRPGGETVEGIEQDNLILDEWFTKQGYSSKDSEFDLIYVNGDNNLENLKAPDDTWKVRLIEEDFFRLMFEAEGE